LRNGALSTRHTVFISDIFYHLHIINDSCSKYAPDDKHGISNCTSQFSKSFSSEISCLHVMITIRTILRTVYLTSILTITITFDTLRELDADFGFQDFGAF